MIRLRVEEFERDGEAMVAIPMADWLVVEDALEDLMLVRAYDEAMAANQDPGIPIDTLKVIFSGTHPLKAYRDLRNLTQTELATMVGVQQPAIARIESRERAGRPALLAKLAAVLDMPLETLIDFGVDYKPTS